MLGKLFHAKPNSVANGTQEALLNEETNDHFHIHLVDKDQIRVVIFLESTSKSHVPLFDSLKYTWDTQIKASEKKPIPSPQKKLDNASPNKPETSPTSTSSAKRTMLEGSTISEMLFGAIPLMQQQEGITTKIHIMKNDQQIMFSKLFSSADAKDSLYLKQTSKKVVAVGVIIPIYRVGSNKLNITSEEATFNYHTIKHFLSGHYLLMDFRLQRLLEVIENSLLLVADQLEPKQGLGVTSSSSIRSFHTVAAPQSMKNLSSVSVRDYSSAMSQLEPKQGNIFFFHKVDHMVHAVCDFQQHVFNLLGTARMKHMIWLDLFDVPTSAQSIEVSLGCFFRALNGAQSLNATKSHFVLSAAVTGTLCHHLSWVNTIAKRSAKDTTPYMHTANSLSRHIEELFGSLRDTVSNEAVHRTFTKILVVGKNKKAAKQVLTVLSYFVRCSIELVDDINHLEVSWSSAQALESPRKASTDDSNESKLTRATTLSKLHVIELADYQTATEAKIIGNTRKLSKSLFAGYSENFFGDFVMMAVPSFDLPKLLDDLKSLVESPVSQMGQDTPADTSSCLIVNLDECFCEVITYTPNQTQSWQTPLDLPGSFNGIFRDRIIPSEHVTHTLQAALSFFTMGLPPASCALYIEDRLAELHSKVGILAKLLKVQPEMRQDDDQAIAVALGVTPGDLQLLFMLWSKTHNLRG